MFSFSNKNFIFPRCTVIICTKFQICYLKLRLVASGHTYPPEIWHTSPLLIYKKSFFGFFEKSYPKGPELRKTAASCGFSAYPLDDPVF